MTHNILKAIMDKFDKLAQGYIKTKDITKLTEFIQFRDKAIGWIIEMSLEQVICFDDSWNAEVYIDYITHKVGCFKPHEEGCNCIVCNEDQMRSFIDWRLAL